MKLFLLKMVKPFSRALLFPSRWSSIDDENVINNIVQYYNENIIIQISLKLEKTLILLH